MTSRLEKNLTFHSTGYNTNAGVVVSLISVFGLRKNVSPVTSEINFIYYIFIFRLGK